jgi:hypothetical protein
LQAGLMLAAGSALSKRYRIVVAISDISDAGEIARQLEPVTAWNTMKWRSRRARSVRTLELAKIQPLASDVAGLSFLIRVLVH